jgi:hypothetical protein
VSEDEVKPGVEETKPASWFTLAVNVELDVARLVGIVMGVPALVAIAFRWMS